MTGTTIRTAAALAALVMVSTAALADGDCESRPLTATESTWMRERAQAIHSALPSAPKGWTAVVPGAAPRAMKAACIDPAYGPLWLADGVQFTPADSALARQQADAAGTRVGQRSDRQREREAQQQAGAATDSYQRMMEVQQKAQAAQARGDMAEWQRLMAEYTQLAQQMAAATPAAPDDAGGGEGAYYEAMNRERARQATAEAAQHAELLSLEIEVNPPREYSLAPGETTPLSIPGAAQAWRQDSGACGAGSSEAVALVGSINAETDHWKVIRIGPRGGRGSGARMVFTEVRACGKPAAAEALLRRVAFERLR